MKLSIIIPVYNEERTILKVLGQVKKVGLGSVKKEIIIVDDFSRDNSRKILKDIKDPDVKVFYHPKNMGKGAAVRTGFRHATGDLIIIQDADLEYRPDEYPKLLKPLLEDKADVVFGSRFMHEHKPGYKLYYFGNLLISFIASALFMKRITDVETCYKVMKKDVVKSLNLKSDGFDIEPEITAKILKKGYRLLEVPIWYHGRSFKEGKKITWKDGMKAIYDLFRYRFSD